MPDAPSMGLAEITGTPVKTMQNWFSAFCKERGLSITQDQATNKKAGRHSEVLRRRQPL